MEKMSKEEIVSKIVSEPVVRFAIVGAPKVGKSAISVRFLTRRYISEYQPGVENNYVREIFFGDDHITYELKDTAHEVDVLSHISWATCIAVVYSIDDRLSFMLAEDILKLIDSHLSKDCNEGKNMLCYALISNKNDLDHLRVVTSDEGKSLAKLYHAGFWEMSAADNYESTYGPIRAMIVEAFFSTTNKPINPVPQNINKTRNVDDFKNNSKSVLNQQNKKISQDNSNTYLKKSRKSSKTDGFKKNSLGYLLLENFAMNDLAFAMANGPDSQDGPKTDDPKEIEKSKKERFRSSIKRERLAKPIRKLGVNQNVFENRDNEKDQLISDTDSLDSNSSKLILNNNITETNLTKDAKANQENIPDSVQKTNSQTISPSISTVILKTNSIAIPQTKSTSAQQTNTIPLSQTNSAPVSQINLPFVTQTNMKNIYNKRYSAMSMNNDNSPLANWNALMFGPEYDLCRIFKGRSEKKSTRMKISAIFKQANL
ncbi:uncharacterized protein LOC100203437 isoform X3 [Hydra vulgaris]|uniref:small monomeric GTPase n=1 Tax=Hydra vulgaris TaxID=6087 RepID=A0ABM4D6Y6_HYDVU